MSDSSIEYVSCDLCGADDAEQVLHKCDTFYVQCRRCNFVYTNPRIAEPLEENEALFQSRLQSYIRGSYAPRRRRAYRRMLRGLARFRRTNRLLEIGSNVGGFLAEAQEQGWDAVGVEPLGRYADYARKEKGLNVISAILEEANLEENHFDVVFSKSVFEHLPSPSTVLREAVRVLRPGGVIYTKTMNYNSYTRELVGAEWRLLSPVGHLSLFTPETLQRFCRQAGLDILKVESSGVNTPKSRGNALVNRVKKSVLSMLSRHTLKGDRIVVLARKPE